MEQEERPNLASRIRNISPRIPGIPRQGQEEELPETDNADKPGETTEAESQTGKEERPGIADKVRFWEEQDRINQELIPRVLKQHELFTAHIETHESAATLMAVMEARLAEQYRQGAAELEAKFTSALADNQQQAAEAKRSARAAVNSAKWQSLGLSSVSIAAAIVAIVLALVM